MIEPARTSFLRDFEQAVSRHPFIRPLSAMDHDTLARVLGAYDGPDPYRSSPAYFQFTGRRGLWLFETLEGTVIFCRHPNVEETVLVFPPIGADGAKLLESFFKSVPSPQGGFQLARFTAAETALLDGGSTVSSGTVYAPIDERVLDWAYPVHVLGTELVSEHQGPQFRDFRQNIHRAERLNLSCRPLQTSGDSTELKRLVARWVKGHCPDEEAAAQTEPFLHVIEMLRDEKIQSLGFEENGTLVAFIVWEETDPAKGTANSLMNLNVSAHKGVSEYSYYRMCCDLSAKGFKEVCIGGSETPSLDRFKRKMNPIRSVELSSFVHFVEPHLKLEPDSYQVA
ncbi:MAG: phosphatidylglycerol lysyltransferase domain-containing protein [Pseudomonadota bacterium]